MFDRGPGSPREENKMNEDLKPQEIRTHEISLRVSGVETPSGDPNYTRAELPHSDPVKEAMERAAADMTLSEVDRELARSYLTNVLPESKEHEDVLGLPQRIR